MRFVPAFPESAFALPRRAMRPLLCVLVLFYLAFHAISGDRGLVALFKETRRLEQLTAELEATRNNRVALQQKVDRMSNSSLDLDMLDERARTVIGYAGKNEVVIFTDSE